MTNTDTPEANEAHDPVYNHQIGAAIRCIHDGDYGGAADACGAAIQRKPDSHESYFLLAVVAYKLDDLGRAIEMARKGHEIDPDCAEGCDILAHIYAYAGNLNDSVYFGKLATAGISSPLLKDLKVDGLDDLARAMGQAKETGYMVEALRAFSEENYEKAVTACEKEMRLRAGDFDVFLLYGRSLTGQGMLSRGIAALQGAVHLNTKSAEAYVALGDGYLQRGEHEFARTCFERAIVLSAGSISTLAAISQHRRFMPDKWGIFDRAIKKWAADNAVSDRENGADRQTDGLKRIGILMDRACVSEQLRYLEAWFWQIDRHSFELYAYSVDRPGDDVAKQLGDLAQQWINIRDANEKNVIRTMLSHDLDLLVDLRVRDIWRHPGVIAAHPARKVVRWGSSIGGIDDFGYDMLIGDKGIKPGRKNAPDVIESKASRIALPFEKLPKISGMAPVRSTGQITFGATCDLARVTPHVAMIWSEILRSVSGSRLLIGNVGEVHEEVKSRFQEMFSTFGCMGHIDFAPLSSTRPEELLVSRLEFVVSTDVFLDSFPNGGGVELADALWSGVPVIAHTGRERPGDIGCGILRAAGQEKWLAKTDKQYIARAIKAADSVSNDAAWRATMHEQVRNSALFNRDKWGEALNQTLAELCEGRLGSN